MIRFCRPIAVAVLLAGLYPSCCFPHPSVENGVESPQKGDEASDESKRNDQNTRSIGDLRGGRKIDSVRRRVKSVERADRNLQDDDEADEGEQQQQQGGDNYTYTIARPKITKVEKGPASRVFGSLSKPFGSKWCNGKPTFWLVGHQHPEHPWCQEKDGRWTNSSTAIMDYSDYRNSRDDEDFARGPLIDRHDCAFLDVNSDNLDDIVCVVGANKGHGRGYNELYLTRQDGSLYKVPNHGLQKYPSLSPRVITKLKDASNGQTLLFIGVHARERDDDLPNNNRMFTTLASRESPFFREVRGPWTKDYGKNKRVVSAIAGDINGDGTDDLVVCVRGSLPHIYVQRSNGSFYEVDVPENEFVTALGWQNARIGHVTYSSTRPDLIVVEGELDEPAFVRVFRGIENAPFFDFTEPYFSRRLPYATFDVEIVDANKDGIPDLYVTQSDESEGKYCAARGSDIMSYWSDYKEQGSPWADEKWLPPLDDAHDILFVGQLEYDPISTRSFNNGWKHSFRMVEMDFYRRGCSSFLFKFGNSQTLILSMGRLLHSGFNYILQWE